jgi:hypothetical protein
MPQNGEVNLKFAVYKNVCCGYEIVLREGATFPSCKNHPKFTTIWNPLEGESRKVIPFKRPPSDPAA